MVNYQLSTNMAVFQLDNDLWFPDPHQGEDDGLIAVGGDLSIDRLLLAYSNGFFPWFSFQHQKEPLWYCPLQRFVIFPNEIHVSHSMLSPPFVRDHHTRPNGENPVFPCPDVSGVCCLRRERSCGTETSAPQPVT